MRADILSYASRIAFVALACGACSLLPDATPKKMAASLNAHAYYEAKYERLCAGKVKGPATCGEAGALVNDWREWLLLTAYLDPKAPPPLGPTHPRIGPRPLLLNQLKVSEAAAKKVLP